MTAEELGTGAYRCFGARCTEDFDSLDEMVRIEGKGHRGPRHFCKECADEVMDRV